MAAPAKPDLLSVPKIYVWESNELIVEALREEVEKGGNADWDRVESLTHSLLEFAQTFTRPGAANA